MKLTPAALAAIAALSAIINASAKEPSGPASPVSSPAAAASRTAQENRPRVVMPSGIPVVPASVLRTGVDEKDRKRVIDEVAEAISSPGITGLTRVSKTGKPAFTINENTDIQVLPGVNVFIPIAIDHPNRILTPFKVPQVISTSLSAGSREGECGEICVRGGVVYISTEKNEPVTAFISEKDREDIAISVTMIPRRIPPREVRFRLPESTMESLRKNGTRSGNSARAQGWETSQPYVQTIREAMRTIALGEAPQGYNLRRVKPDEPVPACSHPGLKFRFRGGQVLDGFNLSVYVGVIENTSDIPVEFNEQLCGGWRVAAVTSWPLTVLEPGQKTEVYMAIKKAEEQPAGTLREPLIQREFN